MHRIIVTAFVTTITVSIRADIYQECAKLYNPNNYMSHLPSLNLPYLGDVPIPNNVPLINPSPVAKTKAIKVVTKYVYKNPVCVKYTKKRGMCKRDDSVNYKGDAEQLVTKEYFVRDRKNDVVEGNNRHRRYFGEDTQSGNEFVSESYQKENEDYAEDTNELSIKGSESPIPPYKETRKTPILTKKKLEDMLIEDRLDQLETILPHYTRRRIYQTSTITVTKVLSNRRATATMLVKNCIPYGYDVCEPKSRNRKSKVARPTSDLNERHYFG
ncbi:hypothetical protein JTB14_008573 [Gonioctena quinquepunctata]|nr:hypothetical protein JTB14_008573 [Gonioctena quinquepunctata]